MNTKMNTLMTKITNGDMARLSIILHRHIVVNNPQDSTEGLEELNSKLKQMVESNTHSHYSLDIQGCSDAHKLHEGQTISLGLGVNRLEELEKEFEEWMNENVYQNVDGSFSTQDAQWRNRIQTKNELKKYFLREFRELEEISDREKNYNPNENYIRGGFNPFKTKL